MTQKRKRKFTVFVMAVLSMFIQLHPLYAQNQGAKKITGKVISKISGNPIIGATIAVKGTKNTTVTDEKGSFVIYGSPGETLAISFVGFATVERKIASSDNFTIALTEDYNSLNDVVVIGYGKMKKTDLSSAQVTVTSADISKTVNTTFDQALQGRAANVYVASSSAQPGAAPSVLIRGFNSLTQTNQPLYVIDGVQIKPNDVSDNPYSHPTGFSNILSGINPDDIETMNILQGPSATAIFGAAGANGVIMITTKRGRAGDTKISASTLWTLQDEPKHIDVMDLPQYAAFRNEVQKAGGTGTDPNFADPTVLGKGTDWQDALYRKTWLQKHELSLSGGTERTTFYFSGEYFNQQGIAPGSGFKRYSTRLNLDNQTRRWLKIGTNLSVNQTYEKVNTTNGGIIQLALQQNPSVPVKNPDGSWGGPTSTQFQFTNPVAIANLYNDYNKSSAFIGGVYADITLVKGLVFHNEANTSYQYYNYYAFHPAYEFGGYINPETNATSTRSSSNNYWWNFNTRLQYDVKIDKHSISAMIGHEAQSWGGESLTGYRANFVTNDVQELTGGDATTATNGSGKYNGATESYMARINYVYNDKYILQLTGRRDGSSNFGENKRWGNFPGISAAWRISQENFMKGLSAVNDLKLRVEYGWSGNSSAGGYYARLQTVPTPWGTGFLASNFPNPNLHWETDKTVNVGFDLHMFNNRLEVIADAYVKNLTDLLTVVPGPYTYGGDISYSPGYIQWPTKNTGGTMRNRGFGITVNTVNIDNKSFTWKTGFNISVDRNKITKLETPINTTWAGTQAEFISEAGQPASMITGYIAEGLFQDYKDIASHAVQTSNGVLTISPQGTWVGDIKFKDLNGDGIINQEDRTIIGNPWPKFTFGFNTSFSYKKFDLNIFVTGSIGNDILNYMRYQNETINTGVFGNYFTSVINFARPSSYSLSDSSAAVLTNPGYTIPRVAPGDPNGNNRMSSWFIEDGSYVRLKNVSLAYNFPSKWISKISLRGLRASVSVQNLLTITDYKGYDPEIGMVNYGGTIMAGIDGGRYPSVRFYSFNVIADF